MDYEKIAKKYGGTSVAVDTTPVVNYASLAEKYGGTSTPVTSTQTRPMGQLGDIKFRDSLLGKGILDTAGALYSRGEKLLSGAQQAGQADIGKPIVDRTLGAIAYGAKEGISNIAGGVGDIFTNMMAPFIPQKVKDVYKQETQTALNDIKDAWNAPGATPTEQAGKEKIQSFVTSVMNQAKAHPELTKIIGTALEDALNITSLGAGKAAEIPVKKGLTQAGETLIDGVNAVRSSTGELVRSAGSKVGSIFPTPEIIAIERRAALTKGFEAQNTRLKSVGNSFNENTIVRATENVGLDGKPIKETITPIDTFSKYNIAPVVDKGSIQMGDYNLGTGELGKIKTQVSTLDSQIDTKLVNTGQKIDISLLEREVINRAENNPSFKQLGNVSANLAKIRSRFKDYRRSYGKDIDIAEINNIRKLANKDYVAETKDVSRIVGDVSRDIVYDAAPDKEIRNLLRQQGELLAAKAYAESINGTKVAGGRLGNMALRTTGAIIGSTLPKVPVLGPLIGAIGGEYGARALQQTQFKSAWTELRALLQRSKSNPQINNANKIPNIAINQSVKTTANNSAAPITKTSSRIIDKTVPLNPLKRKGNTQGGYIKNPLVAAEGDVVLKKLSSLKSDDFVNKQGKLNIDAYTEAQDLLTKAETKSGLDPEDVNKIKEILALLKKV